MDFLLALFIVYILKKEPSPLVKKKKPPEPSVNELDLKWLKNTSQ